MNSRVVRQCPIVNIQLFNLKLGKFSDTVEEDWPLLPKHSTVGRNNNWLTINLFLFLIFFKKIHIDLNTMFE